MVTGVENRTGGTMTEVAGLKARHMLFWIISITSYVLLIINSDIRLYPAAPLIDPWLYVGYFVNLDGLVDRFGVTYYGARLPWVLLGYLFHHAFTPYMANLLLGFLTIFIGVVSLYLILSVYYNKASSMLSALTLAANPIFITHSFWSYVDGPAVAFSIATIAAFVCGVTRRNTWLLVVAGILVAVTVNIHLFSLPFIALALGLLILFMWNSGYVRLVTIVLCVGAGFLAGMAFLCAAAWFMLGEFWFYNIKLRTAGWVVSGGWHEWKVPVSQWLPGSNRLAVPFGLSILGLFLGSLKPRVFGRDMFYKFSLSFLLLSCFLMVLSEVFLGSGRLQHHVYSIFLWIPSFLFVGALYSVLADGGAKLLWTMGISSVVLNVFLLAYAYRYIDGWALQNKFVIIGFASLFFLVVALPFCWRSGALRISACVALGAFLFIVSAGDRHELAIFRHNTRWSEYSTVLEGQKAIQGAIDGDRKILFWYHSKGGYGGIFNAINGTFLWGYALFNRAYPSLDSKSIAKVKGPSTIVLLARNDSEPRAAVRALGRHLTVQAVRPTILIRQAGYEFFVVLVDVVP